MQPRVAPRTSIYLPEFGENLQYPEKLLGYSSPKSTELLFRSRPTVNHAPGGGERVEQ
jgi:hypothetical protein